MKLKKIMKQISALALALVLICTLVPTAFAADRDSTKDCSLTIYKYEYNGTGATVGTGEANQTVPTDNSSDAAKADVSKTAKPLAGVTFQYIKVGDLESLEHTDTYGLVWEQTYKLTDSDLATILSTEGATTAADGKISSGDKLTGTKLNELLKAAVANKKNALEDMTGLTSMGKTDSDGKVQATQLKQGLYLVLETNVPHNVTATTDPFFVSLPMATYDADGDDAESANDQGTGWNYDVVVYPKNQTDTPELTKAVKEAGDTDFKPYVNTAAGDILTYQLTTTIPKIASKVTYLNKYEFVDTLPAGMVYEKDTAAAKKVTVKIGTTTWDSASKNDKDKEYFAVAYDDVARTMTITLTTAGLAAINPAMSEKDVTITYTAKIDKVGPALMGKTGNTNAVKLTYSRSDEDSEKELDAAATVYTYGMKLTKTFSDTGTNKTPEKNGDPTKVEFTVQDADGNYILASLNDKNTDSSTKAGEYTVTGRVPEGTGDSAYKPSAAAGSVFSPDESGIFFLKGLDEGTYTITEIKTDDGYKILQAPVTMVINGVSDKTEGDTTTIAGTDPSASVTITANKAGKDKTTTKTTTDVTMAEDGTSTNAIVPFEVINEPADLVNFVLPKTGGFGSIVFTLLGAVVFAGALLMLKKSKKNKGC